MKIISIFIEIKMSHIDKDGTKEEAKIVRSMIEHENILLNNRIALALITQGFLIIAMGIFWNKNQFVLVLITLVGILSSISFWYTFRSTHIAIENLYRSHKYCKPPIMGDKESQIKILLIWNFLPLILIGFWLAILLFYVVSVVIIFSS